MRKRTANKIFKAILEYQQFQRWDMPYNGKQIWEAAKTLLPPKFRDRYKGWRKETEAEGIDRSNEQIKEIESRLNQKKI